MALNVSHEVHHFYRVTKVRIDHVQLVDVWVEDPVDKSDARGLVWVLIWELHVNLPGSAFKGC